MLVEWEVTVPVTVRVRALSREEARASVALNLDPVWDFNWDRATYKKNWHETAKRLLEDGASYREVSESVNVDRKQVTKTLPGYGWTKKQGVEFRESKKRMDGAKL